MQVAVELKNICKTFGLLKANHDLNLQIVEGHIHAIVGENGAGKSTAMNILYGMIQPDHGDLFIFQQRTVLDSPKTAMECGIGMVHQHFMLAEKITALENIILFYKNSQWWNVKPKEEILSELEKLSIELGFNIPWHKPVGDLPVGQQQQIELIKVLYQESKIIILDEPSAVLTPIEIDKLLQVLKILKKKGHTVILITHKLKEVFQVADRITVLRKGTAVGTVDTHKINEDQLIEMMIGRRLAADESQINNNQLSNTRTVCNFNKIFCLKPDYCEFLELHDFMIYSHEIVGVAALEGQGQNALIDFLNRNIQKEFSLFPEDRLRYGLLPQRNLAENFLLGQQRNKLWRKNLGIFLNKKTVDDWCQTQIKNYSIAGATNLELPIESLSGGNQQKLVVARELAKKSDFILAAQPTRGVDIAAIEFIHHQLILSRKQGCGILLVSSELSELLKLSDRIIVLWQGRIQKEFTRKNFNDQHIGAAMLGKDIPNTP